MHVIQHYTLLFNVSQ